VKVATKAKSPRLQIDVEGTFKPLIALSTVILATGSPS